MTDHRPSTPWAFVACLAVMVVSAAILILLVPAITRTGDDVPTWLMVMLAALTVAAGAAARRLRPPASR